MYVVGVILSEGMKIQGKLGSLSHRTQLRVGSIHRRHIPVCTVRSGGSCRSRQAPSQSPTGLLGLPSVMCELEEWRWAEAVMCLQHPRTTYQQLAGWPVRERKVGLVGPGGGLILTTLLPSWVEEEGGAAT